MYDSMIDQFSSYLKNQKNPASKLTVKNYRADLMHFITWYEEKFRQFSPSSLTPQIIQLYKKDHLSGTLSQSSLDRHFSCLRKFTFFLQNTGLIAANPFEQIKMQEQQQAQKQDVWKIHRFKNHLYESNLSKLTIKNYINDLHQFLSWLANTQNQHLPTTLSPQALSSGVIEEYKMRLLGIAGMSPLSINRKLSSIRKFAQWHEVKAFEQFSKPIANLPIFKADNISEDINMHQVVRDLGLDEELKASDRQSPSYSPLPPIRLAQKCSKLGVAVFDFLITNPLVSIGKKLVYIKFIVQGKPMFKSINDTVAKSKQNKPSLNSTNLQNFKKEFYAPLSISTNSFPWYKKFIHYLLHKRPLWYKRYHEYPLAHYFHLALLLLFLGFVFSYVKSGFLKEPGENKILAAEIDSQNRIITIKQKLTDLNNNPIQSPTHLRFALYKSEISSGSALLWQEVKKVKPDENGIFTSNLGVQEPIPQHLFSNNSSLWLGVTVETNQELAPRQQLPNTSLSGNSKLLSGMQAITEENAPTQNVILALDSTGNLSIGGSANPVFQATNGQFTLSGQPLLLTTNKGSNENVQISPDGSGMIDVKKPLVNTGEITHIPSAKGAVEVDDLLAVLASSSGQSAITINQTDTGPIISASSSGIAKFTVSNDGSGYFAGYLGIGIQTPNTALDVQGVASISAGITLGNTALIQSTSYQPITIGGPTTGAIILSPGSLTPSFVVTNGGNAAIGTMSALGKFTVSTNSNNDGIQLNGTSNPAVSLYNNLSLKGFIGLATSDGSYNDSNLKSGDLIVRTDDQTNGAIRFAPKSGSLEAFTILRTGNIGVGVPNPNHGFQLSTDDAAKSSTTTWTVTSDIRTKEQIAPFSDGLSVIRNINPVNFSYNGLGGTIKGLQGIGVIAQDIKDVAPYTVKTFKTKLHPQDLAETDLYDFNPHALFFVSINAIKELDTKLSQDEHSYQALAHIVKPLNINITDITISKDGNSNVYSLYNRNCHPQLDWGSHGIAGQARNDNNCEEGGILNTVGVFTQLVGAQIQAGALQAEELTTKSLSVTTNQIQIAGTNLEEYISSVVDRLINNSIDSGKLIGSKTQTVSFETIHTNIISPLAQDVTVKLSTASADSKFVIQNGAGQSVASIDKTGNASFSGTLQSQTLQTNDASISGTLRVKKLIADEIQGASTSAQAVQNITNVTNIYQAATASANEITIVPTNTPSFWEATTSPESLTNSYHQGDSGQARVTGDQNPNLYSPFNTFKPFADLASYSAQLFYVEELTSSFGKFNQGLIALGPSSLTDVSVNGMLTIGRNFKIDQNSLNVIGSDLQLQPLRQGGVSFLSGLMRIDTDGNLYALGNAEFAKNVTVQGVLAANVLAPVPDSDLVIQLSSPVIPAQGRGIHGSPIGVGDDKGKNLIVKNASGSAVFKLNQLGDILASGSATISKLKFHFVEPALAISDTEAQASASAGVATISAHQKELTIHNPQVLENSLIYITPVGTPSSQVPFLLRQDANQSFSVGIAQDSPNPTSFNWLIIN